MKLKAKVLRRLEMPAGLHPQQRPQEVLVSTKPGNFLKSVCCRMCFSFLQSLQGK